MLWYFSPNNVRFSLKPSTLIARDTPSSANPPCPMHKYFPFGHLVLMLPSHQHLQSWSGYQQGVEIWKCYWFHPQRLPCINIGYLCRLRLLVYSKIRNDVLLKVPRYNIDAKGQQHNALHRRSVFHLIMGPDMDGLCSGPVVANHMLITAVGKGGLYPNVITLPSNDWLRYSMFLKPNYCLCCLWTH